MEKLYNDILKIIISKMKIEDIRSFSLTSKRFYQLYLNNCYLIPSKNYIREIKINLPTVGINKRFYNDNIIIMYCGYCGWNEIVSKNIKIFKLSLLPDLIVTLDNTENNRQNIVKGVNANPTGEIGAIGWVGPTGDIGPQGIEGYHIILTKCPVKCEKCNDNFCRTLIKTVKYDNTNMNYCRKCAKDSKNQE
jgi:hypothetical protein